jgi:hypothetical protein
VLVREYQPEKFTFWYRMLRLCGPRGLGAIPYVQPLLWRLLGPTWVEMVRASISRTTEGANVFVVARRRSVA